MLSSVSGLASTLRASSTADGDATAFEGSAIVMLDLTLSFLQPEKHNYRFIFQPFG